MPSRACVNPSHTWKHTTQRSHKCQHRCSPCHSGDVYSNSEVFSYTYTFIIVSCTAKHDCTEASLFSKMMAGHVTPTLTRVVLSSRLPREALPLRSVKQSSMEGAVCLLLSLSASTLPIWEPLVQTAYLSVSSNKWGNIVFLRTAETVSSRAKYTY